MREAIYTDVSTVEELKKTAIYARDNAQPIYDELVKTGVDFTKNEVIEIWRNSANEGFIKNKVIDKKLEAEPLVISGLKLSRAKLYDMIEIENMEAIKATYESLHSDYRGHSVTRVGHLLELNDGVFSLVANYEDVIFDICTLFATSPEAKLKATKIINMADHLNELNDVFHDSWREKVTIQGLEIANGKYVPDMKVIGQLINP